MTDSKPRKPGMNAAARARLQNSEPVRPTAARSKPVRITIDLSPELHRALTSWTAESAVELDVPRLSLTEAVRAMIRVTTIDSDTASAVRDLLAQSR